MLKEVKYLIILFEERNSWYDLVKINIQSLSLLFESWPFFFIGFSEISQCLTRQQKRKLLLSIM